MHRTLFVQWFSHVMYIHQCQSREAQIFCDLLDPSRQSLQWQAARFLSAVIDCVVVHACTGLQDVKQPEEYRKIISTGIPRPYQVPTGIQMTSNDWLGIPVVSLLPCESRFNQSLFSDPGFPPMGSWPNHIPAWRVHHSELRKKMAMRGGSARPETRILEAWPTGPHGQERDQGYQMGLWLLAVFLARCFGWKWVTDDYSIKTWRAEATAQRTHHLATIAHLKVRNHRTSHPGDHVAISTSKSLLPSTTVLALTDGVSQN